MECPDTVELELFIYQWILDRRILDMYPAAQWSTAGYLDMYPAESMELCNTTMY